MDITQKARTGYAQVRQFPDHFRVYERPASRDTSQLCTLGPCLLRL